VLADPLALAAKAPVVVLIRLSNPRFGSDFAIIGYLLAQGCF